MPSGDARPNLPLWALLLAAALLGAIAALPLVPSLQASLRDPEAFDLRLSPRPSNGTLRLDGAWDSAGATATPRGADASATATIPPGPWHAVQATVYGPDEAPWLLRIAQPGTRETTRVLPGEPVSAALPAPFTTATLTLAPAGEPPFGAVQKIEVRASAAVTHPAPSLAWLLAALLAPGTVLLLAVRVARWPQPRAALAASGYANRGSGPVADLLAGVAGGAALAGALRLQLRGHRSAALGVAAAALAVVSAIPRGEAFLDARRLPLRPDARGYVDIARTRTFYDSVLPAAPWVREPLWPGILKAASRTDAQARFASTLLGLALVTATALVGARIAGPAAGLAAAGVIGLSAPLADMSADALRTDLIALLVLGVIAAAEFLGGRRWWRAAALGLLGAALPLTQLSLLLVSVPSIGWCAWRQRWRPGEIALAVALAAAFLAPHLALNRRLSGGDWVHSTTVHTRFYANAEFAGQPGWPTREEVRRDPYAGEPMGFGALLRHYPAAEIPKRYAQGFARALVTEFPPVILFPEAPWLALLVPAGLAWWAWRSERRAYLALAGLLVLPVAFFVPRGVDQRLVAPVAPLLLLATAEAMVEVLRRLGEAWTRRRVSLPSASP
jgi:hypothetical protein